MWFITKLSALKREMAVKHSDLNNKTALFLCHGSLLCCRNPLRIGRQSETGSSIPDYLWYLLGREGDESEGQRLLRV